ncbi:MAG: class I SAM-dependent methyltransferase [Anaerolineales bacterium]
MTIAYELPLAAGTGHSVVVDRCQVCNGADLESILFIGFLPPVNTMQPLGTKPQEQPAYPAEVLRCRTCQLVQIGLIVDPAILFPPEYAYTSGTTRILRENFANLYAECQTLIDLQADDLVVDVGSNDGTLLSNFAEGHPVQGIEPTDIGKKAQARGIPTHLAFFGPEAAAHVLAERGPAKIVTATNVFAHIENVHEIVGSIRTMLTDDGVFISESHYLLSLVETLQYDTIYHEHLRYYSLHSLKYLLELHGLEIFHSTLIPTHGGSIRVYAAQPGAYPVDDSVQTQLQAEIDAGLLADRLHEFKQAVVQTKLGLHALLRDIIGAGERIYGIGAPSRASTLINYTGLDDTIMNYVLEVPGSHKTEKYMPGTLIPCVEEPILFDDPPEYAMLLSWHIAEEIMPKLVEKGFRGDFIVPLPEPRIVRNTDVGN